MAIVIIDKKNKESELLEQIGALSKNLIDYMRQFDYYPETTSEQQTKFLTSSLEKGGKIYAFLENGLVIGFVDIYKERKPNNYLIESIFVIPEKRGQGIGKLLLSKVIEDHPNSFINIGTNVSNSSAINFYKKIGFEENRVYFQKKPENLKGVK